MSFQQSLSGLNVASTNLDVIGNNVANANTVGFKQSVAQFTDIFANSMAATASTQVGIGAKVSSIAQQFGQGGITQTNNPLDIAIAGQGFYRLSDNGTINYSRNGQFHIDKSGYIVDTSGANLTGFMADAKGVVSASGAPENLKFATSDISPKTTTKVDLGINLEATAPGISAPFNAADPKTYSWSTSGSVVDSLGASHVLSIFFQKSTTAANTWTVFGTVDGKIDTSGMPVGVTLNGSPSQSVVFDGNGTLQTIASATAAPLSMNIDFSAIDPTFGATTPQNVSLDMTTATQYGSKSSVNSITQDGYTSGRMTGFSIDAEGKIFGIYSNEQTKTLGQIALANFVNPQGLAPIGNGHWTETLSSGAPLIGTPKTGTLGALQSNAIEESNVDLTAELVKMIQAQRMYQANSKEIEAQNEMIQTIARI